MLRAEQVLLKRAWARNALERSLGEIIGGGANGANYEPLRWQNTMHSTKAFTCKSPSPSTYTELYIDLSVVHSW